jgi:hypothetical protein
MREGRKEWRSIDGQVGHEDGRMKKRGLDRSRDSLGTSAEDHTNEPADYCTGMNIDNLAPICVLASSRIE